MSSKRVKNGKVEIKKLDKLTNEKILEELMAVKGIGNWTAEMFLMFSLGRPDVFPADDLGIRRGVEKLLKKKVSSQQLEKIGLRWKPFRTVASWYVWKAVDG